MNDSRETSEVPEGAVIRRVTIDYSAPDWTTADEFETAVADLAHVTWGDRLDDQSVSGVPGSDADEWKAGFEARVAAAHDIGCSAVEAQRDDLLAARRVSLRGHPSIADGLTLVVTPSREAMIEAVTGALRGVRNQGDDPEPFSFTDLDAPDLAQVAADAVLAIMYGDQPEPPVVRITDDEGWTDADWRTLEAAVDRLHSAVHDERTALRFCPDVTCREVVDLLHPEWRQQPRVAP